jgi:hypothetical protein
MTWREFKARVAAIGATITRWRLRMALSPKPKKP